MQKSTALVVLVLLISGCTGEPNIGVHDAKAVPSPMVVDAVSFFMTIENTGDGDDVLLSASIQEFPDKKVELHDIMDGKMQKVEKFDIPAGKTTELKMGGMHLMAFDIKDPGSEMTLVLNFKKSGQVTVKAPVMGPGGGMSMDMGSTGGDM